eukprot:sb/3473304/
MRKDLLPIVSRKMEEFSGMGEQKSDDLIGLLIEANMSDDGKVLNNTVLVVESVVDDLMTVCLVMDNMVKQLCSLFMFLDKEPEVQSKLMTELRSTEINNFRDLANALEAPICHVEKLKSLSYREVLEKICCENASLARPIFATLFNFILQLKF